MENIQIGERINKYDLVSAYRDNEELRASLEALAERTFGIRFEEWYRLGFWQDAYQPYSISENGKVISNISVNQMPFYLNGKKKLYIQLGTVMTDNDYRGQGLNRKLMEQILEEYKERCDGIYLFANDSVLDYYTKFGFQKAEEYRYVKSVDNKGRKVAILQPMTDKSSYICMEEIIHRSSPNSLFEMDNTGLLMYYLTYFMKNSVYYIEEQKAYVIAEEENETLYLHHILSEKIVDLDKVFEAFGENIKRVVLGFTPLSADGFETQALKEEETTLFILGSGWEDYRKEKLRFPVLSHA